MKKFHLLTLVLITFLSFQAFSQEENIDNQEDTTISEDLSYNEGDIILQVGTSFGYYGYGYAGSRTGFTLPLTATLEYGITENISVGPYLGFARWSYEGYSDYRYSWTFISLGARGSFHYLPYFNEIFESNLDESKYDFYLTLIAGIEIRNFSSSDDYYDDYYDNDVNGVFGPVFGFKYYFNPSFGVFFEGGRGAFGYGKIGVSLKL